MQLCGVNMLSKEAVQWDICSVTGIFYPVAYANNMKCMYSSVCGDIFDYSEFT